MAFVAMNGYDVEHASSLIVYENLFPEIQHINGKGCIDTYTKTNDVESVTYIDVMRVLPYLPRFRQLGSQANGAFHNKKNVGGYGNAPQSTKYTIPVDLIYDEGVSIASPQIFSNPISLQAVILAQLVKSAGMAINVITYAKQIEAFFRNGDNFDKALTHTKGNIVSTDISSDELANAIFGYNPNGTNAAPQAIIDANASLSDGIPEIGALVVPVEERQGFISPQFNSKMKSQYLTNASNQAVGILGAGFINPFTGVEGNRIDSRTGMCGTYDGLDLFLFTKVQRNLTYIALGVLGTASDSAFATHRTLLDKIDGIIVYGAGTCRGIVGPSIQANPNIYFGGVYILPQMKVGVEVLHGATIKMIVNGASGFSKAEVASLMNTLTFTAIDGDVVTGNGVMKGFNDGTTN